jgi:outer membrane protein TolC
MNKTSLFKQLGLLTILLLSGCAMKGQTEATQYPEVSAGYSASQERDNDASYTGIISIVWELDLWRKLDDDSMAAAKGTAEQRFLYQSARDTLAAEVMKAWLGLTTASKNIAIEQKRQASL